MGTESKIVQVAPAHENDMIKEMEQFAWNLQGRQEMHVEGDTRPDEIDGTKRYITEVTHYVKLHFVRRLDPMDLEAMKRLESEYHKRHKRSFPSESRSVRITTRI